MATAKNVRLDLGPTGNVVAENMKRIRIERGLTLRELADRLEERGHPIAHSGLSKLENKTRRVDVDDLAALAIALNVSPAALLVPHHADPNAAVEITGIVTTAADAWEWAAGTSAPLDFGSAIGDEGDEMRIGLHTYADSAPEFRRLSAPWWQQVGIGSEQRSAAVSALKAKLERMQGADRG